MLCFHSYLVALLTLLLLFVSPARAAAPDTATLQKRHDEAGHRMLAAAVRAKQATTAVRQATGEPEGKIAQDMAEIDAKVDNKDYEQGLGQWNITIDRVAQLDAGKRDAVRSAMDKLRGELKAAASAQVGQEGIKELMERLGPLKESQDKGDDLVVPLKSVHESLARAELAAVLPRGELVALRGHLATMRASYAASVAAKMLEQAGVDFAELEKQMPDLRREFAGDQSTRDSAHAKFQAAQRAVVYSLARVPESNEAARSMREKLTKLEAEQRAAYAKAVGEATFAALKENQEYSASEFEGWEKEAEVKPVSVADYLNMDGSHYGLMNLPRTAALVNRSNLFLTHAATQEDAVLCAEFAKVKALINAVRNNRAIALNRMHAQAQSLVAELEKLGTKDDKTRERFAVLADWDLRVVMQDDPRQWLLIARLHKLIDEYDRKTLGEAKALAKLREEAAKTSEGNWTRMYQRVPAVGGFDPLHSALFKGKMVRVEKLHDFSASFKTGDHDLVLDIDGNYFAAKFDAALKRELGVQLARAKATLTPEDELELIMVVGDEGKLTLLAEGDAKPLEVTARKMTAVGIRFGPVAFLAR